MALIESVQYVQEHVKATRQRDLHASAVRMCE